MKGYTLIELVVSIAIMSVVILALLAAFDAGQTLYSSSVKVMDVMQVVRKPMDAIIKEVRQSKPTDIMITNSGAQIQFVIPLGINPVTYSQTISYYVNNSNELVREHPPGIISVIAVNIDSINFLLTANRLEVNLQVRANLKHQNLVLPVRETVTLRN
ncbi:MAG: type II secretion system protein [Candidatus Omnitrophota bacterium]